MNAPFKKQASLNVIKIGNSAGVILSKDMLAKLGVAIGDSIDLVETPSGIEIKRHDDGFAAQMDAAREVMARRRNALRELAK